MLTQKVKLSRNDRIFQILTYAALLGVWELVAKQINLPLIWPSVIDILRGLVESVTNVKIMTNLSITMSRVLKGWAIAMVFGIPVGIIMGLSKKFNAAFGGIIHALRQIPMMSWVPLTIIWFGIGDGPTLFMIALNGIFQIVLNTSKGVQDISQDYFNAARSMGANKRSIFKNIVLPGALPDILVGARLALGGGWMSVIWAEFIATSSGLGFSMVEAQTRMQTEVLIALMVMAAMIGFGIDRILMVFNAQFTKWK